MKRESGVNVAGRARVPHASGLPRVLAARATLAVCLAVCLALVGGVGTVLATPHGPGLSVTPGGATPGESVTVNGSPKDNGFSPGDKIVIGIGTTDCSGATTVATGTADGAGNVNISVTVPSTATPGDHVLCVTDQTKGNGPPNQVPFRVLAPASITVSSPIASGGTVTVTGKGFLPAGDPLGGPVAISYGTGTSATGCETVVSGSPAVNVGTDGSFTYTFNAPAVTTNTPITIIAVEPQGTCGKSNPGGPILQGKATGTINAPQVPASLTVSSPVDSGAAVTVSGKNYQPGAQVQVLYGPQGSDGCATNIGTANVGSDGGFNLQFAAPNESNDTHLTVAAVQPAGKCAQATTKATADLLVKKQSGLQFPPPQYCLIGLVLLLLLLLLLFLLFRGRRQDEPVTIEERDRVIANPSGQSGTGGAPLVDRQIIARDARGKEVVIAEEITTVSEDEELS